MPDSMFQTYKQSLGYRYHYVYDPTHFDSDITLLPMLGLKLNQVSKRPQVEPISHVEHLYSVYLLQLLLLPGPLDNISS